MKVLSSIRFTCFILSIIFLLGFFFFTPICTPAARGEEFPEEEKSRRKETEAFLEAIRKRDQLIDNLVERVERLEHEVRSLRAGSGLKASQSVISPPAGQAPEKSSDTMERENASPSPQTSAATSPIERKEEERLAQATLERILIQRSAVLLPPWSLETEPSLLYSHASSDRIIVDGIDIENIVSERVRHDSIISALTFRLGLPWELQTEVRIPYNFEFEKILEANTREFSSETNGLGDIELAVSRQLVMEQGWIPNIVGNVRWRTTTGDDLSNGLALGAGFHGLQFSLSGVKYRDPVAFFGGISYTANLPDTKEDFDIDPGDTTGFNTGMALALNPETSINFQWEQRFTNRTTLDDEKLPGSAVTLGTFRVGFTYALAKDYFLDLGVGIGLTQDAPDMQASLAVPFRIPDLFSTEP